VSRSPFWEIPERVIDINDRFISVMNDKEGDIFCVFTRALPAISAATASDSPALLNSTGTALSEDKRNLFDYEVRLGTMK
jgi:hypothetical protein